MTISEAQIWNKLRQGDKASFDYLYYEYINVLFNYGRRFTSDHIILEECIQDFFSDLWIKRKRLSKVNQIKPYFLLSIKRRLLRQLTKDAKRRKIDDYQEFLIEFSPEEHLIHKHITTDRLNRLNTILKQLTAKQREVVYLKFYEGLSYADIAQIMNVETKAVYKLMARAMDGLKAEFQLLMLLFFV